MHTLVLKPKHYDTCCKEGVTHCNVKKVAATVAKRSIAVLKFCNSFNLNIKFFVTCYLMIYIILLTVFCVTFKSVHTPMTLEKQHKMCYR